MVLVYFVVRSFTWIGRTIKATNIMITTSSLEGQMSGTTSPKPTVEKVTMQKYKESKRLHSFPARCKCSTPQMLESGKTLLINAEVYNTTL